VSHVRAKRTLAVVIGAVVVAVVGAVVAVAATGTSSWSSGWQMMAGRYVYRPAKATPVHTLAAARSEAGHLASRLGLRVDEVLQFKRNFYAKLVDANGTGATEVLVDPASGVVWIEYGPAMMWNTRYGMAHRASRMMGQYGASMMGASGAGMMGAGSGTSMMGASGTGMMGGSSTGMMGTAGSSTGPAASTVTFAQAHTLAQRWLDANEHGVGVESGGDQFPGYYTLETLRAGSITGMISVNAATGALWAHWWHGAYVAKSE
jgi:hypothetical protein